MAEFICTTCGTQYPPSDAPPAGCPICQDERQWVMRPDKAIQFWDAPTHDIAPGLTVVHCPGHFVGGTVLHWAGAGGAAAQFCRATYCR